MGCHECFCAPYSKESIAARITIVFLFCVAQFFFGFVVLNPLSKGERASKISFYVLLAFWIFFSILWIWSHIRTSWLDAGSLQHELERLGYLKDGKLQNLPQQINELPRCPKCSLPKPERAHHCSECGLCYFRFDHHCPVIGNCVALHNMKSFMLFLIYTFLLVIVFSTGCFLSSFYKHIIPSIILGVIGAFIFLLGICVGCFGCSYLPAVCVNRTTLERIAGVPYQTFDVGAKENFQQIFGNSFFAWFLPTKPPISGFLWAGIKDLKPCDRQGQNISQNENDVSNNELDNQIDDQTVEPIGNNNQNNDNENSQNIIENDQDKDNENSQIEIEKDDQLSINEAEKAVNDSVDL